MGLLGEIGDMMILTGKTLVSALRPPYTYGNEFAIQFMFTLRLCWLPLLITSLCVNYAVPGLEGGNFAQILGSLDRIGSFYSLAAIREFAPFVCAIIVSGVAGTAITADLGARKIREELDALQVLGVDPVKNLVVPRFLALMLATALFDVFAIAAGVSGGIIATLSFHGEIGPFLATFWGSSSTTEVWGSLLKCTIYGSIVAIVSCYKGMTASGGAEGVGKAVNEAVVIALLAVGAFNYVFTQTLLATHPDMSILR